MAIDTTVDALADIPFADLVKAAKWSIATSAMSGQTIVINGRTIQRMSVADALKVIDHGDEEEVASSTESPGGIVLVQYGER